MSTVLYCIVSIHLYSGSCSAHQSEALPVRETQREESSVCGRVWTSTRGKGGPAHVDACGQGGSKTLFFCGRHKWMAPNADGRCWKDALGRKRSLRPTGLLTLPGEDWSPPGKRPRNSYMTNLDRLCQGVPEGEKYSKTIPELVKRPKNKQKGSLEESCESLIVGTAGGREERRGRTSVTEQIKVA